MSNIFPKNPEADFRRLIIGVAEASKGKISSYLRNYYARSYWLSDDREKQVFKFEEPPLGFTLYEADRAGLKVNPKKIVELALNVKEGEYDSTVKLLEAIATKSKKGLTPKERGLSRKIELLKTVYDGVLAHEVAHVVTDDGLLLAVSAAKQVVHPQIVEKIKAYDQKMLNVESMPKELRDEIKELIRKETISLTGIEDFSENEEEQFNTYFSLYFPEKASLGNTKHIQGLHNIMIDIYIENALPTILPQRMFDEKGKIVGDDMRTRYRKALMTARELVTPRKNYLDYGDAESLLIKSMGGMAALEKMLFSIIGPYVDARYDIPKDFKLEDAVEFYGFDDVFSKPVDISFKHQKGIKNPNFYDAIRELREINKKNKEVGDRIYEKNLLPYNYLDRNTEGMGAGYFTEIFVKLIDALSEELAMHNKKAQELENEYKRMLEEARRLLREAAKNDPDSKNAKELNDLADGKPQLKSATQMIDEAMEIHDRSTSKKTKEYIEQACDILEQLKYELNSANAANAMAIQAFDEMLPPDKDNSQPQNQQQQQQQQNQQSQSSQQQSQQNSQNSQSQSGQSQQQEQNSSSQQGEQNEREENGTQSSGATLDDNKEAVRTGSVKKDEPNKGASGQKGSQQEQAGDEMNDQQNSSGSSGSQEKEGKQGDMGDEQDQKGAGGSKDQENEGNSELANKDSNQGGGGKKDNDQNMDQKDGSGSGKDQEQDNDNSSSKGGKKGKEQEENIDSESASDYGDKGSTSGGSTSQGSKEKDNSIDHGKTLGELLAEAKKKSTVDNSADGKQSIEDGLKGHELPGIDDALKNLADKGEFDDLSDEINGSIEKAAEKIRENANTPNVTATDLKSMLSLDDLLGDQYKVYDKTQDAKYQEELKSGSAILSNAITVSKEFCEKYMSPVLDKAVQEIVATLDAQRGDARNFDVSNGFYGVDTAAINALLSGDVKTNSEKEFKTFLLNVNFVMDNSGSTSSTFTITHNGRPQTVSYFDFQKGLIAYISEALALRGVGLTIWTFDSAGQCVKAFSETFCENKMLLPEEAAREKSTILNKLRKVLVSMSNDTSTYQAPLLSQAIKNNILEYLAYSMDPESLKDQRIKELYDDNGQKAPSNAYILTTDDSIQSGSADLTKLFNKVLNVPGTNNFTPVRIADVCDRPPKEVFQGLPIFDENKKPSYCGMIGRSKSFNIQSPEDGAILAAGAIANSLVKTVMNDIYGLTVEAHVNEQNMSGASMGWGSR